MLSIIIPIELLASDTPLTVQGIKDLLGTDQVEYSKSLEMRVNALVGILSGLGGRLGNILNDSVNAMDQAQKLRTLLADLKQFQLIEVPEDDPGS